MLRRIFGPKRDEVTGGWRKLHNEELHKVYSSPSTIRMIKSWMIRWTERILVKTWKKRDHQEDPDLERRIILGGS
jgi:hypothetical protein